MSQTDPTPTDPEVYLLQSRKVWGLAPRFGTGKSEMTDIKAYMVFMKTRKPNYDSINPVSELAQVVCFPFYDHSEIPKRNGGGGFFYDWFDDFSDWHIPFLNEGIGKDNPCHFLLSKTIHYPLLASGTYHPSLAVPSWARETVWDYLVKHHGWRSVTPPDAMKKALFPLAERCVLEWEAAHNIKRTSSTSNAIKQKMYYPQYPTANLQKVPHFFDCFDSFKEEKYDEPSRNYALDA